MIRLITTNGMSLEILKNGRVLKFQKSLHKKMYDQKWPRRLKCQKSLHTEMYETWKQSYAGKQWDGSLVHCIL